MTISPKRLPCLLCMVLLASCAGLRSPDVDIASPELPIGFAYLQAEGGEAPSPQWWDNFNSEQLSLLVQEALENNLELKSGVERILQARASVRSSSAPLLPKVTARQSTVLREAQGGGSFVDDSGQVVESGGGGFRESSTAFVGASYQLDLFGESRAASKGARSRLEEQFFNQRALELSIQSDVASYYFRDLALQERLAAAREQVEAAERLMQIVQHKFDAGAISGLELSQERSALAQARIGVVSLADELDRNRNALAILLGRFPEELTRVEGDFGSIEVPEIAVGIPADLLLRRPDLLAAEASLFAADADIDKARAQFFPSIGINLGIDFTNVLSELLGNMTRSISSTVSQTIFSGGELEGDYDQAQARYRELVYDYQQAIYVAVGEVDDALVSLRAANDEVVQQELIESEADYTLRLSEVRYEAGDAELSTLIEAQNSRLDASDSLVRARLAQLDAAISLFVAIGGGWSENAST